MNWGAQASSATVAENLALRKAYAQDAAAMPPEARARVEVLLARDARKAQKNAALREQKAARKAELAEARTNWRATSERYNDGSGGGRGGKGGGKTDGKGSREGSSHDGVPNGRKGSGKVSSKGGESKDDKAIGSGKGSGPFMRGLGAAYKNV